MPAAPSSPGKNIQLGRSMLYYAQRGRVHSSRSPVCQRARKTVVSEIDAIRRTPSPRTRETLAADLRALDLDVQAPVLVHSSLSSLGWVSGGSVALIQALLDVLSPDGTLVMPAFSGDLTNPAAWRNPPVPREWWGIIRDTMPAYDPRITPTRGMGRTAELFRTWPDVRRSSHPFLSFAAWGAQADAITQGHSLEHGLGEGSPLGRLYELNASVLLLGVGYDSNTSFHLAEYRAPDSLLSMEGAPVLVEGRRVWHSYRDVDLDARPFPEIGRAFDATPHVRMGAVGSAEARVFPLREAVDFATQWLTRRRASPGR